MFQKTKKNKILANDSSTIVEPMKYEAQEVRDNLYYKGKSIIIIIAEAIGILIRISEELLKMCPAIFHVITRKVEKTQIAIC